MQNTSDADPCGRLKSRSIWRFSRSVFS